MVAEIVVTTNSSPRTMDPDELGALAVSVFGSDRVSVEPVLAQAIEQARELAEEEGDLRGRGRRHRLGRHGAGRRGGCSAWNRHDRARPGRPADPDRQKGLRGVYAACSCWRHRGRARAARAAQVRDGRDTAGRHADRRVGGRHGARVRGAAPPLGPARRVGAAGRHHRLRAAGSRAGARGPDLRSGLGRDPAHGARRPAPATSAAELPARRPPARSSRRSES